MAAGGAFGGARGAGARPPERGVFPLDHAGECAPVAAEYLACLRGARGDSGGECREVSKRYLECRMERGLMAQEDLGRLGFAPPGGAGGGGRGGRAAPGGGGRPAPGPRRLCCGGVLGKACSPAGWRRRHLKGFGAPPPLGLRWEGGQGGGLRAPQMSGTTCGTGKRNGSKFIRSR